MEDNNSIIFNQVPRSGKFSDIANAIDCNFDLAKIAILNMKGKSAYEIWIQQPGNENKSLDDFWRYLTADKGYKKIPLASESVRSDPDKADLNAIYIYPKTGDNTKSVTAVSDGSQWIELFESDGNIKQMNDAITHLTKQTNEEISSITEKSLSYVRGRIITINGSSETSTLWGHSVYLPVQNGDVIEWDSGQTSTGLLGIYDSNKNSLVSSAFACNPKPRTLTISKEGAAYIRASFLLSYRDSAYVKVYRNNQEVYTWRPIEKVILTEPQSLTDEEKSTFLENIGVKVDAENTFKIYFSGDGQQLQHGPLSHGLIAGHTYRFWLKDNSWDLTGVSIGNYDKFNIFVYNNAERRHDENGYVRLFVIPVSVKTSQTVANFYDFTVPTDVDGVSMKDWWVCAYGRAAVGTKVVVFIEDITFAKSLVNEEGTYTEQLQNGKVVSLKYEDLGSSFDVVSSLNSKKLQIQRINGNTIVNIQKANASGYMTYKIPLENIGFFDVKLLSEQTYYGSVVFDDEDKAIYGICDETSVNNSYGQWKRNYVVEGMSYLLYTVSESLIGSLCLILYPIGYSNEISNIQKKIGKRIDLELPQSYGGVLMEYGMPLRDGGDNLFPIGINLLEQVGRYCYYTNNSTTSGKRILCFMKTDGYKAVQINGFRTSTDYPCGLFLDADMKVIGRIVIHSGASILTDEIQIPDGTSYFVYIDIKSSTIPFKLTAFSKGLESEIESNSKRIEALENGSGSGSVAVQGIRLYQGKINESDELVASQQHVYTSHIHGGRGFFLTLNEGYEIDCGHLYDDWGNLLAYNYINGADKGVHPAVDYYRRYPKTVNNTTIGNISDNFFSDGRRRFWGNKTIPSGYSIVFVIRKYSSPRETSDTQGLGAVDISPFDKMIDQFCYLDDGRLSSMLPDEIATSKIAIARKRIYQLASIGWKALKQIYAAGNERMAEVFAQGKYRFGIPYSEAAQYSKYVGQHVSFYTYLTAIHNRRSVMYTEKIAGTGQTEYGFKYNGLGNDYAASFYGSVCTALTGYAMGLANVWISRAYNRNGVYQTIGLSKIESYESTNSTDPHTIVRPLDIIWYSGHCSIVEDVLLDRNGNVKFIVWAEEIKPTPSIAPLTPELFDFRIRERNAVIYRKNDWSALSEPEHTPYIQTDWMEYPKELKYNDDICTMYGDKPCLAVGDILYLNFDKTKGYTNIVIEKESNSAYSVYDTIVLANNANVTTATGEDTYSDINLASLYLSAGKYRAKLTGNDIESDYTYWEMIGISLSVSKNGNDIDVSFFAVGGTPYLLRQENMSGYMAINDNRVREIDAEDVVEGSITGVNWNATKDTEQNTINSVIKIFVRGDYGVAVKMVEHPDNV